MIRWILSLLGIHRDHEPRMLRLLPASQPIEFETLNESLRQIQDQAREKTIEAYDRIVRRGTTTFARLSCGCSLQEARSTGTTFHHTCVAQRQLAQLPVRTSIPSDGVKRHG